MFGGTAPKPKIAPPPAASAGAASIAAAPAATEAAKSKFLLGEVLKKEDEGEMENRSEEKSAFVEELLVSTLRGRGKVSEEKMMKDGGSSSTNEYFT